MHTVVSLSLEVLLLKAGSGTKWSLDIPASITHAPLWPEIAMTLKLKSFPTVGFYNLSTPFHIDP